MREAMNLALMAQVLFEEGDVAHAEALNDRSFIALQPAGPGWGTILTLCMFGRVAAAGGDHHTARKRLEESLELSRELGISRGVVWSLYFLAQHALAQRRSAGAYNVCGEPPSRSANRRPPGDGVSHRRICRCAGGDATRAGHPSG